MDLTPFKLDIDELVDDYAKEELTMLADMKRAWAARKFSYIYEARPTSNSAFFMQSLFAHAIGHMVSEASLSRRLGELKRLKALVIDAKQNGIGVVLALVKRMLDKNMFLFGFVDIDGGSFTRGVEEITMLQNKRVQIAYDKLLSNTRIDDYLHMDLGMELDLEALKKMSADYAKAKESAVEEAGRRVDVEDIKHIAENKKLVGNMVEDIVKEWNVQKETFSKQTGIYRCNDIVAADDFEELERLLSE